MVCFFSGCDIGIGPLGKLTHWNFRKQLAEGHYAITFGDTRYECQVLDMDLKLTGLNTLHVPLVKV